MSDSIRLYHSLYRIRRFEETVLQNFPRGIFYGTTHTYLGQEANAVGVLENLKVQDLVFSNHRCHGHFLAYGGSPRFLFAELMGKSTGVCGGRGGSQHLHWRRFYSNGVQGGIVPVAVGMALAEKIQKTNAVVVAFLGDGTMGEGALYEALNMASLWSAPVLFVVENNRIAQTTPIEAAVAGSIPTRFSAFGITVEEMETSDVEVIYPTASRLLEEIRQTGRPHALVLHTWRFGPHSKGDDTRSRDYVARLYREHDPVAIQADRIPHEQRANIEAEADEEIAGAFRDALEDPTPLETGVGA